MTADTAYSGRIQALTKHNLLELYLARLVQIVTTAPKCDEFCYVDCFAGPWKSQRPDHSDTSIGIALEVLEKARENIFERFGRSVRMRALFIEKDAKRHAQLQALLERRSEAERSRVDATAWKRDFRTSVSEILDWCGSTAFTFFFIDPFGWTYVIPDILAPLLSRPYSESLINLMYDHVQRGINGPDTQESAIRLLGVSPKTLADLSGPERERCIVSKYKQNLEHQSNNSDQGAVTTRELGRLRVSSFQVLRELQDRSIYHLIYTTRHPKGIIVFHEESEKAYEAQNLHRIVSQEAKDIERTQQQILFSQAPLQDPMESRMEAYRPQQEEVDAVLLLLFENRERRVVFDEDLAAALFEEHGWLPIDLQRGVLRLLVDERIRLEEGDWSRRRKKFVRYDQPEGEAFVLT